MGCEYYSYDIITIPINPIIGSVDNWVSNLGTTTNDILDTVEGFDKMIDGTTFNSDVNPDTPNYSDGVIFFLLA